jgi:D-amino-acid dehydrogenase
MSDARCDVIVIGGGIIGVSVAYYTALAGAEVVLLEKGEIGAGSSSGNAGLVVPSFFEPLPGPGVIGEGLRHVFDHEGFFGIKPRLDPFLLQWIVRFVRFCTHKHVDYATGILIGLNRESIQAHQELARLGGAEYDFGQRGLLFVFADSKRLADAQKKASRAMAAGLSAQILSRYEVRDLEPTLGANVIGGIYYPSDAGLQPTLFLNWLTRQAEARGAKIMNQTEVYGFRVRRGGVSKVLTTKGELKARQIVLAAGAWLGQLGRHLGVRLPIEGGKGISLTFSHPVQNVRQPMILDECHAAVSPFSEALRIAGVLELAGLDLTLHPSRIRGLHQAVSRYLPMVQRLKPGEIWRGLRPCVPDGLPFLGRLQTLANVIVAGGHDTKGVSLGPLTGKYVAQLLGGESLGDYEKPLDPNRF